ncbi:MAG: sigma-E processing peptidase SpoIIGA [Desulfotomaculum sp.]|nr:sigma-E processing peptidase SpoIIGA [Desulfotomaculum sp.]
MTNVIYLDVVLAGNVVVNYAILWVTAKFTRLTPSRWRVLLGSVLGAVYALTVFISPWQWLLFWFCKLLISILMLFLVFAPLTWRQFLLVLVYFYIFSFAMGGIVLGTIYFIHWQDNNYSFLYFTELIGKYFWLGITLALIIVLALGFLGSNAYRRKMLQKNFEVPVTIEMDNQKIKINALLDTGNLLSDPVTGLPVMVVEYDVLKKILPSGILSFILSFYEKNNSLNGNDSELFSFGSWNKRFSIIPFKSVGRINGVMLGVKPDRIIIHRDGQSIKKEEVLVAVHHGSLAADKGYRALLHPELLDAA